MNLTDLYDTYERVRRNQASPKQMLKIMLYVYLEGAYSSRDIETACKRDINFMYLLEGRPAPDHATIARFRTIHFAPCATRIMAYLTDYLQKIGEISGKQIFIDGTKIEANAGRYTFVWKKSVTKNMEKLLVKICVNRSIQVEGSFGILKEDRGFRRFLCRGKEKVYAECILLALSHNIQKLHRKIQNDRTGTHLFQLKTA